MVCYNVSIVSNTVQADTITRPNVGSGWWDGVTGNVQFSGDEDPRINPQLVNSGLLVGNCVRYPIWFDEDIAGGQWFSQNDVQDQTTPNIGTFYCNEAGTYQLNTTISGLISQAAIDRTTTAPIIATLWLLGGSDNNNKPPIMGSLFANPTVPTITSSPIPSKLPIGSVTLNYSLTFDKGDVFQLVVDICNIVNPNSFISTNDIFNIGYDGLPAFASPGPIIPALGNGITVTKIK